MSLKDKTFLDEAHDLNTTVLGLISSLLDKHLSIILSETLPQLIGSLKASKLVKPAGFIEEKSLANLESGRYTSVSTMLYPPIIKNPPKDSIAIYTQESLLAYALANNHKVIQQRDALFDILERFALANDFILTGDIDQKITFILENIKDLFESRSPLIRNSKFIIDPSAETVFPLKEGATVLMNNSRCLHCGNPCEVFLGQFWGHVSKCHGTGISYTDEQGYAQTVNEEYGYDKDWVPLK